MIIGYYYSTIANSSKHSNSIIDWCTDYLIIYFVGIAGLAYYNILAGVLRGLGDSVSALAFLLVLQL